MKTGIIMEKDGRFLTLLTPDGEFLKVSSDGTHHDIGEEIPIPALDTYKSSPFVFWQMLKGKSVVALAIACLFLLFAFLPLNHDQVYAYMSIDVNPSIELGFNKNLKVIELIPYNEEGKEIIEELGDWKLKGIHEVTDSILNTIKSKGYLKKEQEIVISTVHIGESKQEADREIDKTISDLEKSISEDEARVTSYEATAKERDQALENGVTPGKLISEQKKSTTKESDQNKKPKKEFKKELKLNPPSSKAPTSNEEAIERTKRQKVINKETKKQNENSYKQIKEKQKEKGNSANNRLYKDHSKNEKSKLQKNNQHHQKKDSKNQHKNNHKKNHNQKNNNKKQFNNDRHHR
ncbi:anti-sigma factor domain-containing protein [Robertmurraya sp. DFI.2.37]|uniref:anti-sigma factor domain-containing protein n=1 Tax=Robertmurraya sp. DFI.2.37 TaxID=3031819 RepID=UPI0012471526|nr:anti-sigma factor domain-containing protein [Robertmurraya sp. DFI.2.37]MDF1511234.1 anti-sigma factor domain-containing protein [Robertmurraya sp. DFI.2.37]